MDRYSFKNDYSEGAHPELIQALADANMDQQEGYGEDRYCKEAVEILRKRMHSPDADIHFVSGGTQANLVLISSVLKPFESVISTNIGHIHVHEAGAIEFTGHKINTVEPENGKLSIEQIEYNVSIHEDEHMVKPKLVFLSNSTELGTIYSKKELIDISEFCKKNNLLLYLDGARLGSALTAAQNNLSLAEISQLVDFYYIGGTKNGALLGEAIVINNANYRDFFRYHLKQKGALLAKSRIFGIQFKRLFEDNLFFKLASHANQMASKMADGLKRSGYRFMQQPMTNQLFPILPNSVINSLLKRYEFYIWNKIDSNHSAIRLATSWATIEDQVNRFIELMRTQAGTD